eukprot:7326497-Prymnesium_polylepis.3
MRRGQMCWAQLWWILRANVLPRAPLASTQQRALVPPVSGVLHLPARQLRAKHRRPTAGAPSAGRHAPCLSHRSGRPTPRCRSPSVPPTLLPHRALALQNARQGQHNVHPAVQATGR